MRAVRLALNHFSEVLRGQAVLLAMNNTTVMAYVNQQGGTKSLDLMLEVRSVFRVVVDLDMILIAIYVAGRLNVLADSLSRRDQVLRNVWSLNQAIFQWICHITGEPWVDLFATHLNKKLPLCISPIMDPQALAVDTLSYPWKGIWVYAYPPT